MNSDDATVVVRSCAKVNLTLDVLGTRPDGFHAIESVMQTIGLHDTITLRPRDEPGIRVTCDMPGIPTDGRNLAYRAASLLFDTLGINPGLDIAIEKRIPPKAGLGGGSSNAASVLVASLRFSVQSSKLPDASPTLRFEPGALIHIAARIGSDVPFFLVGGTAFVWGRGEEVEPLPDITPWWLVIVKPPFGVSTAWAYRRLDEVRSADVPVGSGHVGTRALPASALPGEHETASERMRKCILGESCRRLPQLLSNDLEKPAIERHPEIAEIKEALIRAGAYGTLMCGSGSAVFGLFESEEPAQEAGPRLEAFGEVFVTRTVGGADV